MNTVKSFDRASELLISGYVGVMPTDTLLGLVAKADIESAVHRLYSLKNRQQKPGTIIASSVDQLVQLGLKRRYLQAVERFWPNPISIVIPCNDQQLSYMHQGVGSLAVRIPADELVQSLLEKTGPLVTSSANQPADKPATSIQEAEAYFGDKVDFYMEPHQGMLRQPSTVLQIVDDQPVVLRAGAATIDEETGEILP